MEQKPKHDHRGEGHHFARYSDREVEAMRILEEQGVQQKVICSAFDIPKGTVSKIVRYLMR